MNVERPRIPRLKSCIRCKATKSSGEFFVFKYTTNQGKESRRIDSFCKECRARTRNNRYHSQKASQPDFAAKRRAQYARWRDSGRKKIRPELIAKRCGGCGDLREAACYQRRALSVDGFQNRCKKCTAMVAKENRYGMARGQYNAMVKAQEGKCAICGWQSSPKDPLHVDHDHKTGRVRGMLCSRCNMALGSVEDDTSLLGSMIEYLKRGKPFEG